MTRDSKILAIYGIQDTNSEFPEISHDHSVAYYVNGVLQDFIQLERISRKKHDNELHLKLTDLLRINGLNKTDGHINVIFVDNILGRSFINSSGNIRFEAPLSNKLKQTIEKGRCLWNGNEIKAFVLNHELAHIYTCLPYFGMFRENSLLIHFDGGASNSNFSAWMYKNGKIEIIEYHWKLKYITSFFNANGLVFSVLGGNRFNQQGIPGKMMGYASLGRYSSNIEIWLKENNWFSEIWSEKNVFFEKAQKFTGSSIHAFDQQDHFIQDIVATMHYVFERDFIDHLFALKEKTGCEYLYYSGGSALNIKTNTEIINRIGFKDVFIPPCCNDSGLALGAGAYMATHLGYSISKAGPFINNWNLSGEVRYSNEDILKIAKLIMDNKVVGICNGYGEAGPRALGNRSIVSLASSSLLAKKVSIEIKKREWYRPLAPIMKESGAKYFTGTDRIHHLSRFMLLDHVIPNDRKKDIQGCVHVDGSARIQVLFEKNDNPFMFDLLGAMENKYGIRALLNTSFNMAGEPIVHSYEDALSSAKKMNLDALVYNGRLFIL